MIKLILLSILFSVMIILVFLPFLIWSIITNKYTWLNLKKTFIIYYYFLKK